MTSTIIDNIALDDVWKTIVDSCYNGNKIPPLEMSYYFPDYTAIASASWQQFLTSLVLWDKIEYFCGEKDSGRHVLIKLGYDAFNSHCINLDEILIPKSRPDEHYHNIISYAEQYADNYFKNNVLPNGISNLHEAFTFWRPDVNRAVSPSDAIQIVKVRTFYYLITCSVLGVNYLPHPFRADFICEEKIYENDLKLLLNRIDLLKVIDKKVLEYCDVVNKKFGRKQFTLNYPLLYDYIKKNSNSKFDELKVALSLREEKDVLQFRKEMSAIEDKIQTGDMQLAERVFDDVNECADSVINKYKVKRNLGELSLGLSPTITLPIQLPYSKPLNLTFLTKLVDFGIHNRI